MNRRDDVLVVVALAAIAVGFAVVLAFSTWQFRADYRELRDDVRDMQSSVEAVEDAITTPTECVVGDTELKCKKGGKK